MLTDQTCRHQRRINGTRGTPFLCMPGVSTRFFSLGKEWKVMPRSTPLERFYAMVLVRHGAFRFTGNTLNRRRIGIPFFFWCSSGYPFSSSPGWGCFRQLHSSQQGIPKANIRKPHFGHSLTGKCRCMRYLTPRETARQSPARPWLLNPSASGRQHSHSICVPDSQRQRPHMCSAQR